jgi:serine/threonine protein kinase
MSTFNSETGRLAPQSLLQQRYIILRPAGRGGMSAVYEGVDNRLQRHVAIKEMSQAHLDEKGLATALALFQQEAQMLSSLSHPNLPHIYASFSEHGRSYLVMDFIEGKTLHQLLREAQGQPLPVAQVLFYARQLCDVLGYLHQQRPPIIFRDVKPTNIMVTPAGQVFLIDFGIARFFKEEQALDTMFLGSPGYAPPEQHGVSQTNARADIYGLGATLHYCLTGRDPYYAPERFVFTPVRASNTQVPAELEQLIRRMVARNEQERPASMAEVAQALQHISEQASTHTSAIAPQGTPVTPAASLPTPPSAQATPAPALNISLPPTVPALSPVAAAPKPQYTIPTASPQQSVIRAPLWAPPFRTLFIVLLVLTLGASAFALYATANIATGWAFIVASLLALLELITLGAASAKVRGILPKGILLITGVVMLVAGFASLTLGEGDVQTAIGNFLPLTTLSTVLPFSLGIAALVSLLWLARPFTLVYRLILLAFFLVALLCTWLAFSGSPNTAHTMLFLLPFVLLILGSTLAVRLEQMQEGLRV